MSYFTTMNLPAPSHRRFLEKQIKYWGKPQEAIIDFENALENFFNVPKATVWTNCFTAIALALMHASRDRSGKVAVSGLGYRRTVDIVKWAGRQPTFVDNSFTTLAMDVNALRDTLRRADVCCILLQHPLVKIAEINDFNATALEFGVPIVYDSVEATGGYYHGKRIAGFGNAEAFSLHPSKVINAAEGGILSFGTIDNYTSFRLYMETLGVICPKTGRPLFFGIEPTHAILGLASLESYRDTTSKHESQYMRYEVHIKKLLSLELVEYDRTNNPNYKTILVKIKLGSKNYRAQILSYLETLSVGARGYYSPIHLDTMGFNLPNARAMSQEYMILPIGHSVSFENIDYICHCLKDFDEKFLKENNE